MQLIHIADICAPHGNEQLSWVFGHAQTVHADLVVCTGNIAAAPDNGATVGAMYEQIAHTLSQSSVDAVFTPGENDVRNDFFVAFGRRYRIDPQYRYLDRLVRVAGVPVLLVDTADGILVDEQVLWLQSQLHDLHRAVVRGESGSDLLVFSHANLLSLPNAPEVEEILSGYRAGRHRLEIALFSRGEAGGESQHPAGLRFYETARFATAKPVQQAIRVIRVNAGEPIETVRVYPSRDSGRETEQYGEDAPHDE